MIQFSNVTKHYKRKTALKEVNLELSLGNIIGLIGENGSGKSTLLKLIAGLIHPSNGEVTISEEKVTRRIAAKVSYLSDHDHFYSYMTVSDTLAFYQSQFADFNMEKAKEMINFMNLEAADKVKHLSKGNRSRLKIILAIARDVPIVLLDEPLSGLDPLVRDSIIKSLISFIDLEKQLILITTHEVMEVEMILDEVIVLKDGQIIGHNHVDDLRMRENKGVLEWMKSLYA
ncbi:spermidine/putrescine ABC transporter ATP-binding protein [Alkalihalobacillus alcalophilus ATCC 27647 = CGMCC 1.3604]|uniref:Multidrug transporter n=1 Tax=Alkalihalobacillus alcalophilus ATCC 27647 = CGMCC 1.3604 TaxID=1218173 RepID=J8TM53_ALKAL|nr:ABC transporter ATP-binding protein [Alkalihalobacillus alcalophilus]AFV25990.1 multidrug transporter [Alkalihalobacillus alcalophilus ATCC 27647 = CGMCC 1.3604]KGA98595.1 spermidine/putrescine ABC transporter ATP-binding protein [Alkalihalobacillus alcalophilus ATCC 27647 = CGMCC 1.3604]MED1560438.1 ABC transporter ATP-binding protein [Alkalihalobacillus alcalophilus]THG90886.1 spermidine/putrescine ABC transporter ATP-binding protein [Alkalihalobacillus alcalophilus ATCC 27647 = CGMCC 1.36